MLAVTSVDDELLGEEDVEIDADGDADVEGEVVADEDTD